MEAADWNIVVLGHWNRAILTPNWIAEKVFCLPPGTPVNVLVPLDGFGPFQVEHGRITVIPIPGQLVFQLGAMTPELLGQASQCARNAISALPATPLRACGINIRFTAAEAPGELIERTRGQTEQLLSDAGYSLQMRRRGETVEYRQGVINVIVDMPTVGAVTLTTNFDRQSTDVAHLIEWLQIPASDLVAEAEKLVRLFSA